MDKNTKKLTQEQIRQTLKKCMPDLMARYGVAHLALFGSYSRNEQKPHSDIDLLVEIENPDLTLFQFVELQYYLSELLGIDVDLVEKDTLKPTIGSRVLQEVVTIG